MAVVDMDKIYERLDALEVQANGARSPLNVQRNINALRDGLKSVQTRAEEADKRAHNAERQVADLRIRLDQLANGMIATRVGQAGSGPTSGG